MKEKIFSLLLIVVLIISLFIFTACDNKDNTDKDVKENDVIENIEQNENSIVKITNAAISQNEAEALLEEYYGYAYNLYCLKDLFEISSEVEDNMYEIYNFEEITQKYMTEDAIDDLIENAPLLTRKDGKYYVILGGISEEYDNLEFKNIKVESNEISAIVVLDIVVGTEIIKENVCAEFSLEKENDKWLIDEYIYYADMEKIYEEKKDESISTEDAIIELKTALEDNSWLKQNVYMKTDCFSNDIDSNIEQVLTFAIVESENESPIIFVKAECDEALSKQIFIVRYLENTGVYAEALTTGPVHQSHSTFKVDGNIIIEEYAHMGYCYYNIYEITNSEITKIDFMEATESDDYHELDEVESKYNFEFIETELNSRNIEKYLK